MAANTLSLTDAERAALTLFDEGTPAVIADARLRDLLNAHRWGRHHDRPAAQAVYATCPACRRSVGAR